MDRLSIRRHMMPASTLVAFVATVLPAGRGALGHLALGAALLGAYWLVEWRGITGTYEGRVPRRALARARRALWLAGLVLCVIDFIWLHWTPWQGSAVRGVGVAIFLAAIGLRLWSMRTLSGAFSYDVKVSEGQELIRSGPYRLLRHPAYSGLLLWSFGFALWNPSLPGLVILLVVTLDEVAFRVTEEERLLADHFGDTWRRHAEATWAVIPLVW